MAFQVEEIDITGVAAATGVTLSETPINPTEVAVDPIGGPAQVYGQDFEVSGSQLTWDIVGSDIKDVVDGAYTVVIRVMYEYN